MTRTNTSELHESTRVVEVPATGATLIYRRNPRRIKAFILNEEDSPAYDVRIASRANVTFTGATMGELVKGGKGREKPGDESIPQQYAVADGVNAVTLVIVETFKSTEED